ncbi:MAG TPA: hypothetical protein VK480_05040 [Solirubrobacterales bacterium]|nr:hypothetical protein [Solirubrobacterales bacterium]
MRSIFDSRRFSSLRLSFAGRGLPERIRTTAFAFLGLTAAAGLIVVAMLAQAGLPLLSPAPLPSGPAQEASIAEAVTLGQGPGASASQRHSADGEASARTSGGEGGGGPAAGGAEESAPAAVESPAPVPASEPGGGGKTGGTPAGKPKEESSPAPAGTPAAIPVAPPEPEATPSSAVPSGPGNSSSEAAAEHASERGIEASTSHLDSANGRGDAAAVPDRGQ